MGIRGDAQLLEMAVKRRWNVDRQKVLDAVHELLESGDERAKARGAAICVVMEKQNQEDEHKLIDVRIQHEHDRLDAIAADLGIDPNIIESVAREAGCSDSGTEAASVADDSDRTR